MDIFSAFGDGISDFFGSIVDAIATALGNLIGTLLYYITEGLMFLVGLLQQMFNVFSGATKVQYAGEFTYLTDVFFQHKKVTGVYWAVALLGITLVIMFTIIAVIRKMHDLSDKMQNRSMGALLGSMLKSIVIMLLLSFFLNAGLSLTNLVINRIGYIFSNSDSFSRQQEIHFTDEQLAAMGRVYTSIGNYSLNESYDSRYNLNDCFNEVRGDLDYLERQGVFDFVYETKDGGKEIATWQSTMQKLIYAANTSRDVPMDKYNEEVSEALLEIMEELRTNPKFYPLKDYQNKYVSVSEVSMDRVLFLSGTTSAANNEKYNEDPYLLDGLRGAFYTGEKSIYDIEEVKDAFNIGVGGISYIFIWVLAYFTLRNLLRCIFGCIMRIFNMVSLYLVAPLAIAPMPLDDGEKFKQWTMSIIIQALGILGSIIPMRLIILFAPIILMPDLVLFESAGLNFIAKVLMIVGGLEAVDGFGAMITGILANNAGMAAVNAGNQASALGDRAFGIGKAAVGAGAGIAGRVAGVGLRAAGSLTGLNYVGRKAGALVSKVPQLGEYLNENGGLIGAAVHALRGGASDSTPTAKDGKSGGDSVNPQDPGPKPLQNFHSITDSDPAWSGANPGTQNSGLSAVNRTEHPMNGGSQTQPEYTAPFQNFQSGGSQTRPEYTAPAQSFQSGSEVHQNYSSPAQSFQTVGDSQPRQENKSPSVTNTTNPAGNAASYHNPLPANMSGAGFTNPNSTNKTAPPKTFEPKPKKKQSFGKKS